MRSAIVTGVLLLLAAAPNDHAQGVFDAAKAGDLAKVKSLVEADPRLVAARDADGRTGLHWACRGAHFEVLKYLVEKGADVNAQDHDGTAPLHSLASRSHDQGIALLIARKADVNVRDAEGDTPLHFAVASRNTELAGFLRKSGATDVPRRFPRYSGRNLGRKPPGTRPEPFVPELFRDIYRSYSPMVFSPDGKEVFWTGYVMPGVGYQRIWWMREVDGIWTAPEVAPFSDFPSWHPMLSADGRRIYFASDRPKSGEAAALVELWYAEKEPDGSWSRGRHLGSPPNRDAYNEMLPSPARDGTIYFKAFGPGVRGTQMYKSKLVNGVYEEPVSIDDLIETDSRDDCPDKDHLITYRFGDPRGAVISVTFHTSDGRWTRPVYMGDIVHGGQGTAGGTISPDGRIFFFVQNITPYWVDASFIESLRRSALKKR